MSQIQTGDVDAFGALYDRYSERASRVAWTVCGDRGRAEEAVQEAFLSLWKSRAKYCAQRGTVAAWLLTAVRYRAIDRARSDQKHAGRRADAELLDTRVDACNVAELAVARVEGLKLRAMLSELPDAQREVITLSFYGGLTHGEIAAALKLPPGTVKGRMRLGLHKLRQGADQVAA